MAMAVEGAATPTTASSARRHASAPAASTAPRTISPCSTSPAPARASVSADCSSNGPPASRAAPSRCVGCSGCEQSSPSGTTPHGSGEPPDRLPSRVDFVPQDARNVIAQRYADAAAGDLAKRRFADAPCFDGIRTGGPQPDRRPWPDCSPPAAWFLSRSSSPPPQSAYCPPTARPLPAHCPPTAPKGAGPDRRAAGGKNRRVPN